MSTWDTTLGGDARTFPSTAWSVFKRLGETDATEREQALERLCREYWKPVYCLIRHQWKRNAEEAKDLTQEFFATEILRGSLFERFTPERGTFRSLLKTAVLNFVRGAARAAQAQKRGGGTKPLPLDIVDFEVTEFVPNADAKTPEELFEEAWRQQVLSKAVELLEQQFRSEGKEAYFEVFKRYDLDPPGDEVSYATVAEALGLKVDTVKNYLTAARAEYKYLVTRVISDYVDNAKDLSAEIRNLIGP